MRVLVIEDDKRLAEYIARGLRQEGATVELAHNGLDGFHLVSSETFDAAVVDIMLPELDGLSIVRDLRKLGNLTPVLILSAKGSVEERVKGLQIGADDYLAKPFSFTELLARLQALVRRANAVPDPTSLQVADLTLDLLKRTVSRDGKDIELQAREFALLEYLVRNKGRVVSKTMIMEHVWGYDFDPHTNVVESRISRLRDKVDKPFGQALIKTVRGAGYVIQEED